MKRVFFILSLLIVFNSLAQSKYSLSQKKFKRHSSKQDFFKSNARLSSNGYQQIQSNHATGILDSVTYWGYDNNTNSWTHPYYKTLDYGYNSNHNVNIDTAQGWNGSKWQTDGVENNNYDVNNNLLSHTYSDWNGTSFFVYYAEIYTYNANNESTSFIQQIWKNNALTNDIKANYSYDSNHHLTSVLYQY